MNVTLNVDDVKLAARGQWSAILQQLGGLTAEQLNPHKHQPCPRCNGTDRFRAFPDVAETGGVICSKCHPAGGDGLATLQWLTGKTFREVLGEVAEFVHIAPRAATSSPPPSIIETVAKAKRMPLDAFLRFGVTEARREYQAVARVAVYNHRGEVHSHFDLGTTGQLAKGKFKGGTGAAGLFFPGQKPQAGETWLMVEGVKDAAALVGLGYLAVGLNTCQMNKKYALLFQGVNVVLVPDLDTAGQDGADLSAARLFRIADRVSVARLPGEIKGEEGDDVRDVLHQPDGEQLVREAIDSATPWKPRVPELDAQTANLRDVFENPNISTAHGRTEIANARRFVGQHGENVRWVDAWELWLVWDGTRWKIDSECKMTDLATSTAATVWHEATREYERLLKEGMPEKDLEKINTTMKGFARSTSSAAGIKNFLTLARGEPGVPILHERLDRHPWLLNVANGTIDLQTGKLEPHQRDHYATKLNPIVYDPEADCPLWRRFIAEVTERDVDLAGFLQRLVGYCLTGSTRDHVLPFLYGSGANGKSVFCATVAALLGDDYAMRAAPELLMARSGEQHPTERADLFGKRLVITNEIEAGKRLNESLVKDLTGGDKIRARRMREDFWEFNPTHKVWMVGNHKPVVRGTDNGIWRRVKLVPFNRVFTEDEQDKQLPVKLLAELPGILNWAINGCLLWQRDGLGEPEAVANATKEYRSEQDIIGAFVEERCLVGCGYSAKASVVYQDYRTWAETAGDHPLNNRNFGGEFGRRFEKFTCNGVVYRGVTLRGNGTDEPDTQRKERKERNDIPI